MATGSESEQLYPLEAPQEYTPYLNLSDSAKAAGVSRKTLYAHIDKGLLSVTRKQGKRLIHVAELERHYGSVTLKTLLGNKKTQHQTTQKDEQIEVLIAAVEVLRKETALLRAELLEARKASEDSAHRIAGLLEDKSGSKPKSWWRKLWG